MFRNGIESVHSDVHTKGNNCCNVNKSVSEMNMKVECVTAQFVGLLGCVNVTECDM